MAKIKYEEYKHIGIVGLLCKTDDENPKWYIDVDGSYYDVEELLNKMTNEVIEIKCDF